MNVTNFRHQEHVAHSFKREYGSTYNSVKLNLCVRAHCDEYNFVFWILLDDLLAVPQTQGVPCCLYLCVCVGVLWARQLVCGVTRSVCVCMCVMHAAISLCSDTFVSAYADIRMHRDTEHYSDLHKVRYRHAFGTRRATHFLRHSHTLGRIGVRPHWEPVKNYAGFDELLDVLGPDYFERSHCSGNGLTEKLHSLIV